MTEKGGYDAPGERLSVGGSDSPRLKVSRQVAPTLLAGQRRSPFISVILWRGFTSPRARGVRTHGLGVRTRSLTAAEACPPPPTGLGLGRARTRSATVNEAIAGR